MGSPGQRSEPGHVVSEVRAGCPWSWMGFSVAECQPPGLQSVLTSDPLSARAAPFWAESAPASGATRNWEITVTFLLAHVAPSFRCRREKDPSGQTQCVFLHEHPSLRESCPQKRELRSVPLSKCRQAICPWTCRGQYGCWTAVWEFKRMQGSQTCLFLNYRVRKNNLGGGWEGVKHYPSQMTVTPF